MREWSKGPMLMVHIVIVTMVNAFFFPLIMKWTGSILYGFLVSVGLLAAYGGVLMGIWGTRVPPAETRKKR
ncbi:hypothetical protein DESC_350042 [Desulfosarcina cetonica]|uniref:hypothetical protein n=1 Tax=Desulfosarcina cetonica TaxID=90730 RepID=UPI0012ED80C2|nr:hypothetical protein [Desulfosarcina cetonica]VTR65577.1 hypothetical protein DESC_350042 [Desulfosarcina cetonica]